MRNSSGRQPSIALRHIAGDANQYDSDQTVSRGGHSDLVRGHTWVSKAAPRRLRPGARTAGQGRQYHRRQRALRVTAQSRNVHLVVVEGSRFSTGWPTGREAQDSTESTTSYYHQPGTRWAIWH